MRKKDMRNEKVVDTRKTKPATYDELSSVREEFEDKLFDNINYDGQRRQARQLLIADNEYTPEAVAMMTDEEVCRSLQIKYKHVLSAGESVLLVERSKLDEFYALTKWLER